MSADRCGVGGRAFVEGGANFAYVPRIKEVAEGNLGKSLISLLSSVRRPEGQNCYTILSARSPPPFISYQRIFRIQRT
jgi:hypothetical protein